MDITKLDSYRYYIYDYDSLLLFGNKFDLNQFEDELMILSIRKEIDINNNVNEMYFVQLYQKSIITNKDMIGFLVKSIIVSPITKNIYRFSTYLADEGISGSNNVKKNVKNLKIEIISYNEDALKVFLYSNSGLQNDTILFT